MKKSATTNKRSTGKRGDGSGSAGEGEGINRRAPGGSGSQGREQGRHGAQAEDRPGRPRAGEPMREDEEVQENNDEHIDQDFPGYPHHPSRNAHGHTIHNGSAGAFDATEHSHDEEDDDQDSDDFAMGR